MGLFRNKRISNEPAKAVQSNTTVEEKPQPNDEFSEALEYFSDQKVSCQSQIDQSVLIKLHGALTSENYDTFDDGNLRSAISSLDANVYNLCKAIIYQNFMLMRKVEALEKTIERFENNQSSNS